jgi:hypothetical protein
VQVMHNVLQRLYKTLISVQPFVPKQKTLFYYDDVEYIANLLPLYTATSHSKIQAELYNGLMELVLIFAVQFFCKK